MKEQLIVGIDVGGTKTAVIRGTPTGTILSRAQFPTDAGRGFDSVFRQMTTMVDEAIGKGGGDVVALSVSIGGPLDVLKGVIKGPPNLPGWDDVPLKRLLSQRFGRPVFIEHDGNAGALAEFYFGAGKGYRNIVFLTMGTGFGAGLILDGKLYRGTSDVAGEIGHVRIAEDGPDCYGKKGSLEGYASGTGIARLAAMLYPEIWPSASVVDLYDAFRRGSHEAAQVFERAAFNLGRGFALLADLLNPERIILGGIGMRLDDALVEPARRVFLAESLREASSVCQIVPAALGESIGDYASLSAALDQGGLIRQD
jgi:glucokinase